MKSCSILIKGITMSFFLFLGTLVYANVYYVDTLASGSESGISWTDAYKSLQDALSASTTGDTIFLKTGVYLPHITDNSISFDMVEGIKIFGGFSGSESLGDAGFWDNRDVDAYETILSGDINGDDIGTTNNIENSLHIITNSVSGVVLDGLTLKGGNAVADNGGAIYSTAGSMAFNNLKFFYNMAQLGGAIAMNTTAYSADSCIFYANSATSTGGALYNYQSNADYSNCVFLDNYVLSSTSNNTQTIYSRFATTVNFVNTIFWLNDDIPGDMIYDGNNVHFYSYCLIKGSPSTSWYSNYGNDAGNNIDGLPHFVDYENLDFDLYDDSPAINTGNPAYGVNIGYYQGSGIPAPTVNITETLTDFGDVLVGDSSAEQNYTVSGSNLLGDLYIIAPTDYELSLTSGDYSGKTDSLTLVPSAGTVATTTIYVRFKPTSEGMANNTYILHNSAELIYPDTLDVSGSGVVPTLTVETNTIPFGNVFLHEHSVEVPYTVSGAYLSGPVTISAPNYFEITTESGNYSGNTDTILIETVDGMIPDTIIYARFSPVLENYTGGYIRHETEGPIVKNKLVTGTGVHGPVYYVDATASGSNDGSNWENAFNDLKSAFLSVESGDTIVVAKGVYKPHASSRDAFFDMVDGVKVFGGFMGSESIDSAAIADRDFISNETVLSGDLGDNDHEGTISDNCYKIVRFYGSSNGFSEETVLDGFTISGGNGDGASSEKYSGAGIYMLTFSTGDFSPVLRNLVFENNRAKYGGAVNLQGVIDAYSGNYTTFENVVFRNNSSYSESGAAGAVNISTVPNFECSPSFINCAFLNNSSESSGGAVYVSGGYIGGAGYSYPLFRNVTFYGNVSGNLVGHSIYCNGQEGEASPGFVNTIFYGSETNIIYNFVTTGVANPTYSHCLITNSPSTSWNTSYGNDLGNNIDGDPMFVDADNNIVSVYTGSPVLGTGDATYGNNIGYYQGTGEDSPSVLISNELTSFGAIEVGEVSEEQQFDISGSDLMDNILITAPTGFEISLSSGAGFINESPMELVQTAGSVSATTVYVRFAPLTPGVFSDSIQISTTGLVPAHITTEGYAGGKPTISAIANIDACTGDTVQTAFTVSDDDVSTCTVAAVSDNQSLLPDDSIVVVGGNGNYDMYIMPPNNSTGTINISVTVTDSQANDSTVTFSLNLTTGPVIEVDFTQRICRDDWASIRASVSGGIRPVQYWFSSIGSYGVDSNFYNLSDGDYIVIAKDANNCKDTSGMYSVETPDYLTAYIDSVHDISCYGENDGSLIVKAQGGWGSFEYSLDDITYQKEPGFMGLVEGYFSIIVRDSLGCNVQTIAEFIQEPSKLEILNVEIQTFGNGINSINITSFGGISPVEFSIDGTNYQQDNYFYDLDPGSYTAYFRDFNNCMATYDFTIDASNVFELLENDKVVYPNPVRDDLYIDIEKLGYSVKAVSIATSDGKILYSEDYALNKGFPGTINLSSFKTGIYLLHLKLGDNRVFVKHIAVIR